MSKVTVTQFDGDRKAIIYCNFRIASSPAETHTINVSNLVKKKKRFQKQNKRDLFHQRVILSFSKIYPR